MVAAARYENDDRADSLRFRFDQEKQLLDKASRRVLFGWARFNRNHVFDEEGKDTSVTDGRWIITLGQFGLVGFGAEFGLLALAVFRGALALKFAKRKNEGIFLAALALIVAINMIDLLPNASLSPWTWLLTGALLGRAETLRDSALRLRGRLRTIGIREAQPVMRGVAWDFATSRIVEEEWDRMERKVTKTSDCGATGGKGVRSR
jgi:hypothetical protein